MRRTRNCWDEIKEAVQDGARVMAHLLVVLLSVYLLCSCNTKKHIVEQEHISETHYQKDDSLARLEMYNINGLSEIRDYFLRIHGKGEIVLFDPSMAIDTGGGFYAPVIAKINFENNSDFICHVEKNDSSMTGAVVTDSISRKDSATIVDDFSYEEKKEKNDRILPSLRIVYVLVIVLLILIVWYRKKMR